MPGTEQLNSLTPLSAGGAPSSQHKNFFLWQKPRSAWPLSLSKAQTLFCEPISSLSSFLPRSQSHLSRTGIWCKFPPWNNAKPAGQDLGYLTHGGQDIEGQASSSAGPPASPLVGGTHPAPSALPCVCSFVPSTPAWNASPLPHHLHWLIKIKFFKNFYWSIVDLQC